VQATGKSHEGVVSIPKPGGVRKGWRSVTLVVSDLILACYERSARKPSTGPATMTVDTDAVFALDLKYVPNEWKCV
jgi:hypothetical protein